MLILVTAKRMLRFHEFFEFFLFICHNLCRHNKQNGISGTVMGEHTRTILSFLQTQPPTRFAAPRGLRKIVKNFDILAEHSQKFGGK